jgi:hypothetical protein
LRKPGEVAFPEEVGSSPVVVVAAGSCPEAAVELLWGWLLLRILLLDFRNDIREEVESVPFPVVVEEAPSSFPVVAAAVSFREEDAARVQNPVVVEVLLLRSENTDDDCDS